MVLAARARPAAGTSELVQTQPRAQRPRSIGNWQALVPVLEAMPEVAAVSPMVVGARRWRCAARPSKSIALVGVDLDRYDRIVGLRSKVVDGTARLGPGRRHHRPRPGRRPGRARRRPRGASSTGSVSDSLRVTALVDLGVRELNRRTVIVPLRTAQSLVGLPGGATSLDLTLVDIWSAQTLADDLRRALALQGRELAAGQCAAGVGAERAVGEHRR